MQVTPDTKLESTKSNRWLPRVGSLTCCLSPNEQHTLSNWLPSGDGLFEKRSHSGLCTLKSPTAMAATVSRENISNSDSNLLMDSVSLCCGGLYQRQSDTGPQSQCTINHDRSSMGESAMWTTFCLKSSRAKRIIPPRSGRPTRRSKREIFEYPESVTNSVSFVSHVSVAATSAGCLICWINASNSARFAIKHCTLRWKTQKLSEMDWVVGPD